MTATSKDTMEQYEHKHFIARLGMDNLFAVFYSHPHFKNTYECIFENNTYGITHKELIMDCLREFATRNEMTGEYLLEHFGKDIKITRPIHATRDVDTHFNIEGKNGSYHIYTNRAGRKITKITYVCQSSFPY